MNEPTNGKSDITGAVLASLRDRPTLNTPTLIAMELDGAELSEVEDALHGLVSAGRVLRRPTGWKLAPQAG